MIYQTVHFTDLTFDPDEILRPKHHNGVVPSAWPLQVCELCYGPTLMFDHRVVERWLEATFDGRWSLIPDFSTDRLNLIIAFENDTDAALFVLLDGNQYLRALCTPARSTCRATCGNGRIGSTGAG
jgi:hypothetical protein